MKLYHWSSKILANYTVGDIIVMARNDEEARDKVFELFKPLEDGNPFEDSYLQLLQMNYDADFMEAYIEKLNELREDLNQEPTILTSGVALIEGGS